jgi:GNAT superfamily N-acetyltransferase
MIARTWRGWTKAENANAYERLLVEVVYPGLQNINDYRGGYIFRRDGENETEFVTVNLFTSLDAVKTFAGSDYTTPVYEPEAKRLLARIEPFANHYEVKKEFRSFHSRSPLQEDSPYLLRSHRAGDMGWVVSLHGELYADEYGWNEQFEGMVAGIIAEFIAHFDPGRECCRIAERDGKRIGSVFLVKKSETTAVLRLLLVVPEARGCGVGSRLVDECIGFARRTGYSRITLWTNSVLTAARHIYRKSGFHLIAAEPHHSFGCDLVGETWEMTL